MWVLALVCGWLSLVSYGLGWWVQGFLCLALCFGLVCLLDGVSVVCDLLLGAFRPFVITLRFVCHVLLLVVLRLLGVDA